MEIMSIKGKVQFEGVEWGPGVSRNSGNWPKIQAKQVMKYEKFLSKVDFYHNLDPLFRLELVNQMNQKYLLMTGR